jgi:hypothetical protein
MSAIPARAAGRRAGNLHLRTSPITSCDAFAPSAQTTWRPRRESAAPMRQSEPVARRSAGVAEQLAKAGRDPSTV